AFFDELGKYGFVEGVNLSVQGEFSTPLDRADAIAMRMVEARPDAILTGGAALTRIVQRATRTVPILSFSDDLVAEKAVASRRWRTPQRRAELRLLLKSFRMRTASCRPSTLPWRLTPKRSTFLARRCSTRSARRSSNV